MHENAEAKRGVRAAVRARRAARSDRDRTAAGERLAVHLRDLVRDAGAGSVTCYLPVRGEPDTRPFLAWAAEQGLEVLLPISREAGLLEWRRHCEETAPGMFGIPEPAGDPAPPDAFARTDLMLIPACAVDERGMRLGWGRGYFDRALAALPERGRPAVYAVIYDDELLPEVPAEPHDMPIDGAVSPGRVVRFG